MKAKPPKLDKTTIEVVKSVLAMPPKPHQTMKLGRDPNKERGPKDRAASAKRRTA